MAKILLIDDDVNLNNLIAKVLKKNNHEVYQAHNVNEALDLMATNYIELIITDIMMPGVDGYVFTESLRKEKMELPILIITAKESFKDKEKGFNVGADDYMIKPINLDELVLRVNALLRRSKIHTERRIEIGNEKIILPQKEFNILFKLLSYPNQLFTRTKLMNEFWGIMSDSDERTVDVHINRLREKFKNNPDFEIVTARGLGYKVVKKHE